MRKPSSAMYRRLMAEHGRGADEPGDPRALIQHFMRQTRVGSFTVQEGPICDDGHTSMLGMETLYDVFVQTDSPLSSFVESATAPPASPRCPEPGCTAPVISHTRTFTPNGPAFSLHVSGSSRPLVQHMRVNGALFQLSAMTRHIKGDSSTSSHYTAYRRVNNEDWVELDDLCTRAGVRSTKFSDIDPSEIQSCLYVDEAGAQVMMTAEPTGGADARDPMYPYGPCPVPGCDRPGAKHGKKVHAGWKNIPGLTAHLDIHLRQSTPDMIKRIDTLFHELGINNAVCEACQKQCCSVTRAGRKLCPGCNRRGPGMQHATTHRSTWAPHN
eukprot:PhM_4_TR18601/c0_g2_i2/m.30887